MKQNCLSLSSFNCYKNLNNLLELRGKLEKITSIKTRGLSPEICHNAICESLNN